MKDLINKFTLNRPETMIKPALWIFIEGVFVSFPAVAVYFAVNILVNGWSNPSEMDYGLLWKIAGIMMILFVFQVIISTMTHLNTFVLGAKNSSSNKISFIEKLQSLPLGYYSKKETGELINTFTGDFLAIEQGMVGSFVGIFGVVFSCILTSIFMFIFNPTMALAFYLSLPITAITVYFSLRMFDKLSIRMRGSKDQTAISLNEYLLGMKTLRSYNQIGGGFSKLKKSYIDLKNICMKTEVIGGTLSNIALVFVKLGLPLMSFTGVYLILGGGLSVVDYLSLLIVGSKILSPLVVWVSYTTILRSQIVSANRIDSVMTEKSMGGSGLVSKVDNIEFRKVSFSYGGHIDKVLDEVSFSIEKNTITAIVGPSGGGKSTILRLIARFWDVESGEIVVDNKELKSLNNEEWLKNISMVLQDVYLFNDTIRGNIIFGRQRITDEEMISAAKKAGCHDFIMKMPEGYDTVVGEGGSTLSGGEKQRISIARAILKDSPILLLDEPTASLDARNELLVQKAISDLVKGRTVIIIAHRLKTIENADKILVLDKGRIVESGNHRELIEEGGLYNRLWQLQNDSKDWNI